MTTGPSDRLTLHSTSGADPENLARSCFMRRSCDGHHASAGPEYIIDNQRRAAANLRRDDKLILQQRRRLSSAEGFGLRPELGSCGNPDIRHSPILSHRSCYAWTE